MKLIPRLLLGLLFLGLSSSLLALQRNTQRNPYDQGPGYLSSNGLEKAGFIFARLRYNSDRRYADYSGYGFRFGGGWSEDFPKGDRQFVEGAQRLTRLKARPEEEVIEPDTDDMYDYPWLYAVNVGTWQFTDAQAARLREYLMRGGFMIVDSFHGEADWQHFMLGMRQILPGADNRWTELDSKDEIFHVLYDLDERFQVPGYQYISTGRTYEKDGFVPHWRAIRDDKGRIMVLMDFNMHLGDAWEHADDPQYPERFSSLAYRLGINYIIYGMTH